MQRVTRVWLADAYPDTAAGSARHLRHRLRPVQDFVHPVQRRRIVDARVVTECTSGIDTWLDVHWHGHIRLNPLELLATIQRQGCFVRRTGVLGSADWVLASRSEEKQPATPGEPLYAPADTKFRLDDLAYLGIGLSRFRQRYYSDLMRRVNRQRNLTRARISGPAFG